PLEAVSGSALMVYAVRGVAPGEAQRKGIAALGTVNQLGVQQTRGARAGGRTGREVSNRASEALVRAGWRKRNFRRVNRTDRANRWCFVGGHLLLHEVRDGNRSNDQNDRHDDQKLDKRETLLLLHNAATSLREREWKSRSTPSPRAWGDAINSHIDHCKTGR